MDSVSRALLMTGGPSGPPPGQQEFTTAGTFTWVAPVGVTSVSVVCVGGGSSRGAGGLGWKNNIPVTPGTSYTVVVGAGAAQVNAGSSYFISLATVSGGGGRINSGGGFTGDGGGSGGGGGGISGGGAGGYSGNGGASASGSTGFAGVGGAGGSGASDNDGSGLVFWGGGGGGVGILGQGADGTAGVRTGGNAGGGGGGSGGLSGGSSGDVSVPAAGGLYGGAGSYAFDDNIPTEYYGAGARGAVRIIWPGNTRLFPSTNTGNV